MTTRKPLLLALLGSTSALLVHSGCGSTSDDSTWLPCAKDEFRLVGQLDGQSVDIRESTLNSGGGMTQLGTCELNTQMTSFIEDPSRTKLELHWTRIIADGATTDATGTVLMPNSGVLASQAYCLGSGTQVHMSADDEAVQFKLAGITGGSGCGTAVAGALDGCWR